MRVSSNVVSTAVACATWLLFAHGCGGSNSGSGFGDDGNNGGDNGGDNGGGSDSGSFGRHRPAAPIEARARAATARKRSA